MLIAHKLLTKLLFDLAQALQNGVNVTIDACEYRARHASNVSVLEVYVQADHLKAKLCEAYQQVARVDNIGIADTGWVEHCGRMIWM